MHLNSFSVFKVQGMEDISRQKIFCCIYHRTNVLICQEVRGSNERDAAGAGKKRSDALHRNERN